MERISANGEIYVKASSIARELGYTADYVGQLCRGGHVDAQLVGRTWFVSEASIREHKRNRYRSTSAKSREALKRDVEESVRGNGRSVISARAHYNEPSFSRNVQYETDERSLIPDVSAATAPRFKEREERSSYSGSVQNDAQEAFNDQEESVQSSSEEEVVHVIPLRKTNADTIRARHIREEAAAQQVSRTPKKEIQESPYREGIAPEEYRSHVAILTVSLLSAVAIIVSLSLVGFEAHLISDSGGSYTAYELNFATLRSALQ